MRIAPVADIKAKFSQYLAESEEGPIIVTKNGRAVAVLVSVTDEAELERIVLAHTPRFRRLLDAAERRIRRTGGITHTEFWGAVRNSSKKETEPRNARGHR